MTAEDLARLFHDNYERLAPSHGYETRRESAKPWEEVPENNRKLMIATCAAVQDQVATDLTKQKDGAYQERDRCVAMMAMMAQILGLPCGLGKHDPNDASWDKDWMNIVYIEFPAPDGRRVQCSWHVHDSEMFLFQHLPPYEKPWDGHTTDEKYQRMADICSTPIGEP